jgi:hypothetical protein
MIEVCTAICYTEVPTTDKGKDIEKAVSRNLDGVKLLKDLDDGTAGASGIVEVFVKVVCHVEFQKPFFVVLVVGEVGHVLEERSSRDGGEVYVVKEQSAEGGWAGYI